jgi:hypothetical protein
MSSDPQHDSRADTLAHILRVAELLMGCAAFLLSRASEHDKSKLEEPEKSAFDRLKALSLSGMVYGSEEYRAILRAEKPAIDHHYQVNSHHPEFYGNGVNGMTLLDVLEMFMDWKAASERMANGGDIMKSIELNTERFALSPQLAEILRNTARDFDWIQPSATTP